MKFPITLDCSIVISGILLAQTLVPRRVSSQYRIGPDLHKSTIKWLIVSSPAGLWLSCSGFCSGGLIHSSSRSYYLFFNYLSYYLYVFPLSAEN